MLVSLDDFGDAQLFEDKTIYSSILLLQKTKQDTFVYSSIDSANRLWAGEEVNKIELNASILNKLPWRLTTDMDFLAMLQKLDQISVPLTKHTEIFNASLLPSRIRVSAPVLKPRSATIDFWDEWSKETTAVDLSGAIEALRKQSK